MSRNLSYTFLHTDIILNKVVEWELWQVYVSSSLGAAFNFACVALYFESAVLTAHPVSEVCMTGMYMLYIYSYIFLTLLQGIVGGFLSTAFYSVSVVFLLIFFAPIADYIWMNYVLIVAVATAIPLFLLSGKPMDFVQESK